MSKGSPTKHAKMHLETADTLRIHSLLEKSRANGPGLRAVIWLQGCPFRCPGCFNPELLDPEGGEHIPIPELFTWLASIKNINGLSLSGGEPTEQIPGLLCFLSEVKERTGLSILLFSGRTIHEIHGMPGGSQLMSLLDVLIDGPYDPDRANPPGTWPSSANQGIHLLTSRYSLDDFSHLPVFEVIVTPRGEIIQSGLGRSVLENTVF